MTAMVTVTMSRILSRRMVDPRLYSLAQPVFSTTRHITCVPVRFNKKKEQIESKIDSFNEDKPFSPRQQLKILVRDYGSTTMVVHITISLFSLACCYLMVRTGLPLGNLIRMTSIFSDSSVQYVESGGTFAFAYLIHKSLLPFRAGATIMVVPVLVKTLRNRGILKPIPVKKAKNE